MRALLILVVIALATPIAAQEGHPLTGTWYGEYEVGKQKRDLTIIMKWDGKQTTGTMNPGPNAVPIRSEERRVGKECRSRWSPYH